MAVSKCNATATQVLHDRRCIEPEVLDDTGKCLSGSALIGHAIARLGEPRVAIPSDRRGAYVHPEACSPELSGSALGSSGPIMIDRHVASASIG